jgi:hypothetical protein
VLFVKLLRQVVVSLESYDIIKIEG